MTNLRDQLPDQTVWPTDRESSGTFDPDDETFALVEQFVEHLSARNVGDASPPRNETPGIVDWPEIRKAVNGADSLEQQIGRAVLVADQMSRRTFEGERSSAENDLLARLRRLALFKALWRRPPFGVALALSMVCFLVVATAAAVANFGGTTPAAYHAPIPAAVTGNAQLAESASAAATEAQTSSTPPLAATAPPAPAPPSLVGAPPLRPHEVFGFAPYWTLPQSGGFNVTGITTLAYFSIGVNADGSLSESGPGWDGYQSQSLANLITRAHGAGDRVVLTVSNFDQHALDQLTSSPTAPQTLASALVAAIQAKNLDGVNLDFEGAGSGDQAGLTNLVAAVSSAIHGVNAHYQVTMDTYASSAGDANGFYNIAALNPVVDGFFIMQYGLNLQSGAAAQSPLTSTMFSDRTAVTQYVAAVPPAKVILGLPYFGVDWPTSDGTLTAQATGPATTPSYGQIKASGHPLYWDSTTDTAWTSYQVGAQWHETFFENPTSLYDAAKLASAGNLGGVGIWALGMDGNDPAMLSALLGFSPAVKVGSAGPSATSQSPTTSTSSTSTSTSTTTTSTTSPTTTTSTPGTGSTDSTTTSPPPSTTTSTSTSTTTTVPPAPVTITTIPVGGDASGYKFSGTWEGHQVVLTPVSMATASTYFTGPAVGPLTVFETDEPAASCLASDTPLTVQPVDGTTDEYLIVTQQPTDCVTAAFTFHWS